MRELARAAQVVFDLQRRGMATTDISFVKNKQPMAITVTITERGRRMLDEAHT